MDAMQLSLFGESEDTMDVMPDNIQHRVQYGDLWSLGGHKLLCGDSTNADDVARLFADEKFALCFTSPPYSDQRTYKLGAFDWHSLMCGAFDQIIEHGMDDCHILINLGLKHENRSVDMYWMQWLMYCAAQEWPVFGWYTWDKGNGIPHVNDGRLGSSHEFIFHFNKCAKAANKWVKTTGRLGGQQKFRLKDGSMQASCSPEKRGQDYKYPDSVIRINRASDNGGHTMRIHPAAFPVALPEFIMHTWSQPDDIVYEPFCGSGTSIIAGSNLKRRVYACEIEPTYNDLAIARYERHTGEKAVLLK